MHHPTPRATVIITTKNRSDDALRAIRSALNQSVPVEVLVIDDASTDGTSRAVRQRFPQVRLYTNEHSGGYIVQRNRAARLATAGTIISIDDDAEFSTPLVVEQALDELEAHPRIAAVAIPAIDVNRAALPQRSATSNSAPMACDTFVGCAHAVRRDVFLSLGGYREALFHQGEERDYSIRLLASGHVVRLGGGDPVLHYESATRDVGRMDLYGRRNDILYVAWNVPAYAVPAHFARMVAAGVVLAWRTRRPGIMIRGLALGVADAFRLRQLRDPVPAHVYRLSRALRRPKGLALTHTFERLDKTPPSDCERVTNVPDRERGT